MSEKGADLPGRVFTAGIVAAALAAMIYLGAIEAKQAGLLPEGQAAPAFALERYGGGKATLSELKGKVVMLDFWATWCPPCVDEMPSLVRLAREYESKGLVFVAASRDDPPDNKAAVGVFVARRVPDLGSYAAFADDPVAAAYKIQALPTLYFIDRQGRVLQAHSGSVSASTLREWIEQALTLSP